MFLTCKFPYSDGFPPPVFPLGTALYQGCCTCLTNIPEWVTLSSSCSHEETEAEVIELGNTRQYSDLEHLFPKSVFSPLGNDFSFPIFFSFF